MQIVSLVNFTLLSQGSFVPSLASVTKYALVGHFLSLREPTTKDKLKDKDISTHHNNEFN